jgi:tRNA threonylcarbamoyladenosine biosynthesis protein TsaB
MAVILAVETATKACSVALCRDGECIALREELSEKLSHAEKINVFAQEVLDEAGMEFGQVDAFAVGTGPGSYTGLRIGVSAVKGWCFATDRPAIGLPTLRILVEAALKQDLPADAQLWPMIDARRMEVFTQPFDRNGGTLAAMHPLILDRQWVDEADSTRIVFGDGADKAAQLWSGANNIIHLPGLFPSANNMAALAEVRYEAKKFDDLAGLVPEYGKAANVTSPSKK